MDPFEHFEEEQRSWEHIRQLPLLLRVEAVMTWLRNPGAGIAGILIERGTRLHPDIVRYFEGAPEPGREGLCTVTTMALAHEIVAKHGNAEAEDLAREVARVEDGYLFIVAVTPSGVRFGTVLVWEPRPDVPTLEGEPFGEFNIRLSRNDELKILRDSLEIAKGNPEKPGQHCKRIVAKQTLPDGFEVEWIKLYAVDLRAGEIVITESVGDMVTARARHRTDSIG